MVTEPATFFPGHDVSSPKVTGTASYLLGPNVSSPGVTDDTVIGRPGKVFWPRTLGPSCLLVEALVDSHDPSGLLVEALAEGHDPGGLLVEALAEGHDSSVKPLAEGHGLGEHPVEPLAGVNGPGGLLDDWRCLLS